MKKRVHIFFVIILLSSGCALGQISPKDSIVFIPLISPSASMLFPGGDMVDRFGINGVLGGGFTFKTRENWLFGIDYGFIFGNNVKEDGILDNIKTTDGFIINEFGEPADVDMFERGHTLFLKGGKVLPHIFGEKTFGPNENSGILLLGGIGFLQHKIHITGTTLQLTDAYKEGYDRLSNGLALSQFVGYIHISDNRMLNFYCGLEFIQAWTSNKRGYNFDQMAADTEKRLDVFSGVKAGWILPLYKKVPDEFYYD